VNVPKLEDATLEGLHRVAHDPQPGIAGQRLSGAFAGDLDVRLGW
jgi:hypothetical protein